MKYTAAVLSVSDIRRARKFYEELFHCELYQDYGINVVFTCGLALQQNFGWLVGLPEEQVQKQCNHMELCFEEERFDEFLDKLRAYPDVEYLGDVFSTAGASGWCGSMIRMATLLKWENAWIW